MLAAWAFHTIGADGSRMLDCAPSFVESVVQMIHLEVWLYGSLSQYAREESRGSHAQLHLEMTEGARMRDLLERLGIPLEEKGITFINAQLTDLPGLAADLERELQNGDRIGLFHRRSMWPFQYRFGASTSPGLIEAMQQRGLLHHSAY